MSKDDQNPLKPAINVPKAWDAEKDQDYFRCISMEISLNNSGIDCKTHLRRTADCDPRPQ